MNIIESAFAITAMVERFRVKVRDLFYRVILIGRSCPQCEGTLSMTGEGCCQCDSCSYEFDPTIAFQQCPDCGGLAIRKVRRYACKGCGADISSKYLFDGMIFDRDYFAQKMSESRQRKAQQKQQVQERLAENRSDPLTMEATDLYSVPGLVDALNNLTQGVDEPLALELKNRFDLNRYQDHVSEHIDCGPIDIKDIPAIIEDTRLDLIWRFVATVFLEHYGQAETRQEGQTIWVMKHDNRKGQRFLNGFTQTDGFEGSVG